MSPSATPDHDRWDDEPEPEQAMCPACGQPMRWSHGYEICTRCDRDDARPWR